MTTIAMIGAGYVGLVTGACFAQKGNTVVIIENNINKINSLLEGKIPFYEPDLAEIVTQAIQEKKLIFEQNIAQGLKHNPSIIFSCVGTPPLLTGAADLSYVKQAAEEIGQHMTNPLIIVNKSTTPVGTARLIKKIITKQQELRGEFISFDVASNPEFLKEGDAVNDFINPDRVVVGIESESAAAILFDLYKPFLLSSDQFICMDIESAELTKYASNVMLATRISFMNQLALFADLVGADINQVKKGMANDRRIGPHFLNAGIGYGGSCFPKDVKALIHMGKECHFPMTLIEEVDNINNFQRLWFINRIHAHYGPTLSKKTAGIWGLSFKPETDDIRGAPSLDIIDDLIQHNVSIVAYDPIAQKNISERFDNAINFVTNPSHVLMQTDFLIILTESAEFLRYMPSDFLHLNDRIVFDGRNCFDPERMASAGINYLCVGRNNTTKREALNSHHITMKKTSSYEATL